MRILYIITQADGGGAQKYTLALAKYFGGTIAAGDEANKLFDDAKSVGIETHRLTHLKRNINPWHDLLAIGEIRQLIKMLGPDIVHLNSTKAGVLGSFAAMGLKTKVVFTAHGFRFNEPLSLVSRQFYLALEKVASSYRDFIITASDADKKSALDNNLIEPNKIKTIHNGIGTIIFLTKGEARAALKLPMDKIIIGCVANFYKSKGVDVLAAGASMLANHVKNQVLVVLIGEERSDVNVQPSDIIIKLGKLENASKYLKAFDIIVIPSRKEGFPFVMLEAMQAELPIIATNVGGNNEGLFTAGRLIDPSSPQQIAQAITELIADKSIIMDLGRKAAERSKLFTEQKMFEETEKVYAAILKK